MENILQWGLNFIRTVQTWHSPPLTGLMKGITWLGSAQAYLIMIPFIYWCIDEKKGLRLALTVLVSAWLNISLKFLLDQPRPFFPGYDPSVGMISERLGGLPSGHAQNALVIWIIVASWIKKKWAFIGAGLICLLVSFSRIYLGVHFPSDVLGGWLLGGLILCGYFMLGRRVGEALDKGSPRAKMIAVAACAFIMILYRPSEELLMPGAILLGIGAGYILNCQHIGFTAILPEKKAWLKACFWLVRFALGITVTTLLYIGLEEIFYMAQGSGWHELLYFFRFALVGLWVSAGAPWLFCRLHLAERGKSIIL
jgi:membrane-associated phospholipid phosphatase